MTRRLAAALLCAPLLLLACSQPAPPKAGKALTVFAASSLQSSFDRVAKTLQSRDGITTTFNYAGTQTLVSQLTQGAPADVLASADTAHMTQASKAGLIKGSPVVFAHNTLEIAVARGNPKGIHSLADLAAHGLVVVLADPSVPAGGYAQQALGKAGVSVQASSYEQQVSAVVAKVALGEADAGIVYHTDILASGKVDGVAISPAQNVEVSYPIAVLKSASNPVGAADFIDLLTSTDGKAILRGAGFIVP